jgi:hypothetical protein
VTINTDPQYALLDAQRLQAQSSLQTIQTTIATLNQEITVESAGSNTLFRTLDAPLTADRAASRTKLFLTDGGIGLAVGLVACIIYVLIVVRRDNSLYTVLDVEKAAPYPILMQVPQLSQATKASLAIPAPNR